MNSLFDLSTVYGRSGQFAKAASTRNAIGEVGEMFACAALGMDRQAIDGRKLLCSDAEWNGAPVEIKCVGKSNSALIYKWRFEKEWANIGPEYQYVFVRHDCRVTTPDGRAVIKHFGECNPRILLVKLQQIKDAIGDSFATPRTFRMFTGEAGKMTVAMNCDYCHGAPLNTPCPVCYQPPVPKFDRKKMHGSQRAGYVEGGWQFTLKRFVITAEMPVAVPWNGGIARATVQLTS